MSLLSQGSQLPDSPSPLQYFARLLPGKGHGIMASKQLNHRRPRFGLFYLQFFIYTLVIFRHYYNLKNKVNEMKGVFFREEKRKGD